MILEQAAALSGQGLTSFALASALEKARATVAMSSILSLSKRDPKRFFEILNSDEEPATALKAAMRRYLTGRG